ncbi:DUF3618 domain-containing protein [Micromonospora sp. NPDC023633]|uniref:DUF3618 domain-containing protein n=1 Tax=Micromonospora sp. NPDC023633 TaxID=3154320 RepID=UPI0033D612F8
MTPNESSDPDRTRADIEATRAELGATVQALAARTNVRARGRNRALDIGGRARQRLTGSAQAVRERTAQAVRTTRPGNGGTKLDAMARAARRRRAALRDGAAEGLAALRGSVPTGSAAGSGPAAARALRNRLVGIRSAARHRPALIVVAAAVVGLVVTMRQQKLGRRGAARRRC